MKNKAYMEKLRDLQAELCELQDWVKEKGLRVIILFEGRDGAGKGGTIRALTERVSPRVFRVVALPAPSDREKSHPKWYGSASGTRSFTMWRTGSFRGRWTRRCGSAAWSPSTRRTSRMSSSRKASH